MKNLLFALCLICMSCEPVSQSISTQKVQKIAFSETDPLPKKNHKFQKLEAKKAYRWVKQFDAPFDKSYNFQMFVQNDALFALHPKGTWKTHDGKTWTKTALPHITNLAFMKYVQFKGAVYAIGTFQGNIEHFQISTAIYRTTDFERWEKIADHADFPKRFFRKMIAFQDKLWLLGGTDGDGTLGYNDIWYSDDAIHWQKAPRPASWSPRMGAEAIIFQEALYLIGGGDAKGSKMDVWRSLNGFDWERVTAAMHPTPFFGYASAVFDDKIWLLGCNRSGEFRNEVMVSNDGASWTPTDADWSPRGGIVSAVFQDRLLLTGGKYSEVVNGETQFSYYNDVWTLEKTD